MDKKQAVARRSRLYSECPDQFDYYWENMTERQQQGSFQNVADFIDKIHGYQVKNIVEEIDDTPEETTQLSVRDILTDFCSYQYGVTKTVTENTIRLNRMEKLLEKLIKNKL